VDRLGEHLEAYRYNWWANERMLDAVAALEDEAFRRDTRSSFPSVQTTLVHILAAEWIWLRRWTGESPGDMPAGWDAFGLDDLRRAWEDVEAERTEWLEALTDADLDRVVEYRNIAGEPHSRLVWQMLRHVVNHSSYHRGQVTTMLRQLDAAAPTTDLIYWFPEAGGI
jgi:uncharacterized damage-inducible protein DinB